MKYPIFNLILVIALFSGCRKQLPSEPIRGTGSNITIVNDVVNGQEIIVAGSEGLSFGVAYSRKMPDGVVLEMEKPTNNLPVICIDQEGNEWDVFGICVSGPRLGQQLPVLNSALAYYFSFNAIYPGADIYNVGSVDTPDPTQNDNDWSINTEYVAALSGFDAIHSVEDPQFILYKSRDYLVDPFYVGDDERITAVKVGNTIRAYPHNIFVRHEVINDEIEGIPFTLSFCPLTATSYCWKRDNNSTFGVSGMLFNNNLIMYDRETQSLWSQIMGESVFGAKRGQSVERLSTFETTFLTLESIFDFKVEVMTRQTGFIFDYSFNPYGVYNNTDDFLVLPTFYQDQRLPNKERVIGVAIDGKAKIYPLSEL